MALIMQLPWLVKFAYPLHFLVWYEYEANTFQANNREVDFCMTREQYRSDIFLLNDFLSSVGAADYHIASAKPNKTLNYATILSPYDGYIWAFIAATFITVMLAFTLIDKIFSAFTGISAKNYINQSESNISFPFKCGFS